MIKNEVVITPEMEKVGGDIIQEYRDVLDPDSLAKAVYIAMYNLFLKVKGK